MGKKKTTAPAVSGSKARSPSKKKIWRPWEVPKKSTKPTAPPPNSPAGSPSQPAVANVLFEGEVPNVDGLCYLLARFPGPLKELTAEDVEAVLGKVEEPSKKEEKGRDDFVEHYIPVLPSYQQARQINFGNIPSASYINSRDESYARFCELVIRHHY